MEYVILLIMHILKSIDSFVEAGFPIANFLTASEGLVYWFIKLTEIYSALI